MSSQSRQLIASLSLLLVSMAAHAADGPIKIVVGYPPGGASDRVARLIADGLQKELHTPVIVENKVGAGGRISAQAVKSAQPNDPVLLLANPAVMVVAPVVFPDAGYDAEKDFTALSLVNDYEFGIAVAQDLPVSNINELTQWLKAHPQQANFGVPATGSLPHFFGLMLGDAAKTPVEIIGYRGSAPLVTDLIGKQVPVAIDTFDVLQPQHTAQKIRLLAISGTERNPLAGDVATLKEQGLNIVATGWNALFTSASMNPALRERLGRAVYQVMQRPETRQQFTASLLNPVAMTTAQTEASLRQYRAQWVPVVHNSGFKP